MKKKTILCMVLLCCTMLPVMAAEEKIYRDYINGYSGYAIAEFLPSKNGMIIHQSNGEFLSISEVCDLLATELAGMILGKKTKLTKEENFLIWSALNEYELLDGEVYMVGITTDPSIGYDAEFLLFLVTITDNGRGYTWYGGLRCKEDK